MAAIVIVNTNSDVFHTHTLTHMIQYVPMVYFLLYSWAILNNILSGYTERVW